MTVTTKFNVGDTAHTLNDNMQIVSFPVDSVSVFVYKDNSRNVYLYDAESRSYNENLCFHSKEDLIDHIQGK